MKKIEIENLRGHPVLIERYGQRVHVIGILDEVHMTRAVITQASIVCDEYIPILSQVATGGHQTISVPLNQIERIHEIEID